MEILPLLVYVIFVIFARKLKIDVLANQFVTVVGNPVIYVNVLEFLQNQ